MSRNRATETNTAEEHDRVIAWYREQLLEPAELPQCRWPPVALGPTWQRTKDGFWLLPDATLGWDVLGWCGTWLQHSKGKPWRFTLEQARFILHWYAINETGTFSSRDGVFQRLKGHGKDPLGACICAVEFLGPCRFLEWEQGAPLAIDVPEAWVQTAAVSLEQTKNTMRLFPTLFTDQAKERFRIQVGKEKIYALSDQRMIEAVTSAPATLEGARSTFVLLNETQHWTKANSGIEMAQVIDRNAAKSSGGAARTLRITNAYEPGEDSVAEHDREAWESIQAGRVADSGLLYDSLEAPPDAPLSAEAAPEVLIGIRGDSIWLDPARIVKSIIDVRNPPSRSRRFWYNQITATEDAWLSRQEYDARADSEKVVSDGDIITLGFDGSFSDDHTALIGCSVDQDHLFEIGVWEPEQQSGEINRSAVDLAVRRAMDRYDVVGFYGDLHPWESYIDTWAQELGSDLLTQASTKHPIAWDMRARGQQFTQAAERLHAALVDGPVTHDGSSKMAQHFYNARRRPNRWGVSVGKEGRESARKIDSVPAAVLARLARMDYLALPESKRRRKRSGRAAFL